MEAFPRGQSVYETSAIPRVTSGLPHGAVLHAWPDSVTKQPHASMQQSIAVAGVEERDVCGTRQPKALGPVTALPGASNILSACVRSAVTVIRPVTTLPGPSAIQDLPACVESAVPVIQPVTSWPTSLQLPAHDEIAVAKERPSASETAQPSVCRDQSGDHVDAAALEPLSNWPQRPEPSPCVTRGTVDAAALDPLSNWAQRPEPSPCVTRGTVDAAAPDLLSSWAKRPVPPAACGLLSASRGSIAQVVGHAPRHSQNIPFSCSGVASGNFYALDPECRQIIDTATSAGAHGYLTALPPSSGLPLSSASGVDAIPCCLNLDAFSWGAWPRDAAVTRTSKQAGKALRSQGHQYARVM